MAEYKVHLNSLGKGIERILQHDNINVTILLQTIKNKKD